jgi:hypothetical protein
MDNLAVSVAIGIAIGTAIGMTMEERKKTGE